MRALIAAILALFLLPQAAAAEERILGFDSQIAIRADGTLGGYGGGLWRKKWLLEHEKKVMSGM